MKNDKQLDYPMDPETGEYDIPEEDKQKVLAGLYPFKRIPPSLDGVLYDTHEGKTFICKEYKVVWDTLLEKNLLYSPYCFSSGGSVIDWRKPTEKELDV